MTGTPIVLWMSGLATREIPDARFVHLTLEESGGHTCGVERGAQPGVLDAVGSRRESADDERLIEITVEVHSFHVVPS